jgi:hypothetical protein
MGLYLKKVLHYPADQASQLLQVWKATVRQQQQQQQLDACIRQSLHILSAHSAVGCQLVVRPQS